MSKLFLLSVILLVATGVMSSCKLEVGARCGPNHDNMVCDWGRSCSQWGWCGTSQLHHDTANAAFSNRFGCPACNLEVGARCGPAHNDMICRPGRSCSQWGWCGTTGLHHDTANAAFSNGDCPTCNLEVGARCGASHNNQVCRPGRFCSQWDWCGDSDLHKSTSQAQYSNGQGCYAAKSLAEEELGQAARASRLAEEKLGQAARASRLAEEELGQAARASRAEVELAATCKLEVGARCGPSHDNMVCNWGRSCSQWGWCGTTGLHHDTANNFYSNRNGCCNWEQGARCGPNHNNMICRPGRSCSQWGWCGTTGLHHDTANAAFSNGHGCQTCNVEVGARCGAAHNNQVCNPGRSCSQWDWCGDSNLHKSTSQPQYSNGHGC